MDERRQCEQTGPGQAAGSRLSLRLCRSRPEGGVGGAKPSIKQVNDVYTLHIRIIHTLGYILIHLLNTILSFIPF